MPTNQLFDNVLTEIAGVSIAQIADEYGTPTYVYDADIIRQQIEKLRQFDVIRYAQKANSNLAILNLMRGNGVLVDAVSEGEILRAEAAGFDVRNRPHDVVYTADIFDQPTLDLVVERGLHINVGSPDMIAQYGEQVESAKITLRINPGFGHGHSQKTNTGGAHSKHGIWHTQIDDCIELAGKHNLKISGLHMHIGSGTDFEHLSQVCDAMRDAAIQVGSTVETISAGGGLPTPYRQQDESLDIDRYYRLWNQTREQLQTEFGHAVSLEIEPGRFLVAESGYLISEIRAIKTMGDNLFYVVDAGFNNLARPIMYGAYHPISICHQNEINRETQRVVVGGPLCESGDIFTQSEGGFVDHRDLPIAQIGDLLVIQCAGAYGFVMSSNYNSKTFAAEVLIEQGHPRLIRKRQTTESVFADEMI